MSQVISLNLKGKVIMDEDNGHGLVEGRFGISHVFFVVWEGDCHFYGEMEKRESLSLCIHEQGSSIVENFSIPTADPMFKTVSYHW